MGIADGGGSDGARGCKAEHPLAGNPDVATDPKPSPDLAVALALPGRQVGIATSSAWSNLPMIDNGCAMGALQRAEGLRLGLQQFHLHGQDPLHGAIQFRLHRIALALLERGVDPADRFLAEDLYDGRAEQSLRRSSRTSCLRALLTTWSVERRFPSWGGKFECRPAKIPRGRGVRRQDHLRIQPAGSHAEKEFIGTVPGGPPDAWRHRSVRQPEILRYSIPAICLIGADGGQACTSRGTSR